MCRYRLEVDLRSLIGVTTNHYRHPRAASWPSVSLQLLNTTGKLQADWKFFRAAERIYNQQVSTICSSVHCSSASYSYACEVYCTTSRCTRRLRFSGCCGSLPQCE